MSDWRWDMTNWVAVSMSKNLALKVSLQWQYDNDPALIQVNAYQDATASLVDLVNQGGVTTEAEKLDTIFTTSLVFKF